MQVFVDLCFTQAEDSERGTNEKQTHETERKMSGKGKKETQIKNRLSIYPLVCKVLYAGILRHDPTIT